MKWFRRMLHRERPRPETVLKPQDRAELAEAKATHSKLLSRADEAIRDAMAHADDVFYRGPERRRLHR